MTISYYKYEANLAFVKTPGADKFPCVLKGLAGAVEFLLLLWGEKSRRSDGWF
jgi:hypothetical protein